MRCKEAWYVETVWLGQAGEYWEAHICGSIAADRCSDHVWSLGPCQKLYVILNAMEYQGFEAVESQLTVKDSKKFVL